MNIKLKSVNIEHPKTSYKLTKTIKQAEKVSEINSSGKNFNSPLYSDTTKCVNCFGKKKQNYQNDLMLIKFIQVLVMSIFWLFLTWTTT